MPLSWNEIRDRAVAFSREWKDVESEAAESKSFWDAFFNVFGIPRRRVASFERRVKKLDGKDGYIDLLWKGTLLIEQKSRGRDLDLAYQQALSYFEGLKDRDLPRYVLVSDFHRFRLFDLDDGTDVEFGLKDLSKRIKHFAFIAGYIQHAIKEQDPVNIKAAEQMGRLHDHLRENGYTGHPLEVLLVRLLFCLFADDTGIFELQSFRELLESRTSEDGTDLGSKLADLFQVLNTEPSQRQKNLDVQLAAFPYVNGQLFAEPLPIPAFDRSARETLLDCCRLDWGGISPAIFGALFQSIMDPAARRNIGAHYTSEENILKLIRPLFLDSLWEEFGRVRGSRARLVDFHTTLRKLKFFDPACGCGNFLVITYRELRLLELEILRAAHSTGQLVLDIHRVIELNVDQFYGIELEEFPAQIAQVALWLVDHQMNQRVAAEFGQYFARIPLVTSPHIRCANALRIDWGELLDPRLCSFILGNPPFVGAMVMSDAQREDMAAVFGSLKGYGILDYVSCWYWKAAAYMASNVAIDAAFVSTNSITQGEQVGLLWRNLQQRWNLEINFAHRTFRWSNEARGVAAVHCVIIGFGHQLKSRKRLFEYDDPAGMPHETQVANINAYLVDAPSVFLDNRSTPLCTVPAMRFGSMPRDGGHLILSEEEKDELLSREPAAARWVRPYTGAYEFLNGVRRYCLWLVGATPDEIAQMPLVLRRVEAVRDFRLASKAETTRRFALTPSLFCQIAQPDTDYLLVPRVSSERRRFVPIGFVGARTIGNDQILMIPEAAEYHLGVLSSTMHNAWIRYTCGRLKSDFRYSKDVVYNNFPWPEPTEKQRASIRMFAKGVLSARAVFSGTSLARLYDPITMPPELVRAHRDLDAAVDAAYSRRSFARDDARVAFLFERYASLPRSLVG